MSAIDRALRAGKGVWRNLAPAGLRTAMQPLVTHLAERRMRAALAAPEPAQAPGPLIVSGLLSETKGVSEAARLTLWGMEAAGYQPIAHNLRRTLDLGPGGRGKLPGDRPGGVWLLHVNAPEAIHVLAYLDPASWRGRYRIGYWAYELPRLPALWVRAAPAFHEIWVPSRFVADSLAASGVKTPVRIMPHPVALGRDRPPPADAARGDRPFTVIAMGDVASSPTRKNLFGAIDIFRRAFPAPGKAKLIVKMQGRVGDAGLKLVTEHAGGRADIAIIADSLSGADLSKLIASADVLLSPHRAEGFGLPLAEAFLLGVPALATGWSGNLDFMEGLPELLIRSSLAPVRDPFGVYPLRDQDWADPDVEDGATKLKVLAADPDLRARLAAKGKQAVERLSLAWTRGTLDETVLGRLVLR